jgi:polysaccharide biosynthesis PFTS motif protein
MDITFLKEFEELSGYEIVYISDNIQNLDFISSSKKTLLLIYPNIEKIPKKCLKKNIHIKNLALSIFNKNYTFRWKSHSDAIKFVENNYKSIKFINTLVNKVIKKIILDKKSDLLIKNYLCGIFEQYFFYKNINLVFKKYNTAVFNLLSNEEIKNTHNYLKSDFKRYYSKDIFIFNKIKYNHLEKWYKLIQLILYPFFSIVRAKTFFNNNNTKIKNCIRQYVSSFGVNDYPALSEDWIIDKKFFNIENTAFVLEDKLSLYKMNILKKKNYNYINANINYPIHYLGLKNLNNIILKYIPLFFINSLFFLFLDISNRKLIFTILVNALIWENFIITFRKQKYITQNNFSLSHFVRNYFLNNTKSKVFLYKHSFSENVFSQNYKLYCHSIFAYNCHDYEFQMSKIGVQMSISNRSAAKKIYISGPVWGSSLFDQKNNKDFPKKNHILALTSSFSPHGVNGHNEHFLYFKYLNDLLNFNKKLKIILKLKSDLAWYYKYSDYKNILKKLESSKRFFIIKENIMARKLINETETIISMPFTTPCFESLYLKKKCFFIDISGNYTKSLISVKTDKFISHDYKSSINLFNFYQNNSDRNIKNIIDDNFNYIFGKTMSRDPISYIKKKIYETN